MQNYGIAGATIKKIPRGESRGGTVLLFGGSLFVDPRAAVLAKILVVAAQILLALGALVEQKMGHQTRKSHNGAHSKQRPVKHAAQHHNEAQHKQHIPHTLRRFDFHIPHSFFIFLFILYIFFCSLSICLFIFNNSYATSAFIICNA
jgi:ABC-type nickel/cobalt efflux system permease component RcnA